MKQDSNIESLVQKFNHGTITREELLALLAHFKEHAPGSELLNIYQKAWDSAASDKGILDPAEEYSMIVDRINKTQVIPINRRKVFMRNFLKYAAVFVSAFAVAWFANNMLHTSNKQYQGNFQNIEVPYGSKSRIELPDGSVVTLNSGSRLKYENGLGKGSRTVYLTGEAYFDIKKDEKMPFYVNTSGIKIKVLGTSFNVKAYPEEKTVETTLISGKVEIFKSGKNPGQTPMAVLVPGQKAVFDKNLGKQIPEVQEAFKEESTKLPAPIQVEKVINPELATGWKDNQFVFDNERFEDLVVRIERWYNVEIELSNTELKNARFSGKFDKETIEQAMKALTLVTRFHYEIEKNQIKITK
jgi:ferric-dicitrate binding protein FerR (iron transport regulator)